MLSKLKNIEMPHVFTLLTYVIFLCSILTYIIPSGSYQRETREVSGRTKTMVIPGTYIPVEKHYSLKGITLGEEVGGKSTPVSITQLITSIPRGLEKTADIIFLIFILGGVFGVLQRTGTIVILLNTITNIFKNNAAILTAIIMILIAIGGSTAGMGEEFIPLVPLFILISDKLGYDRIYGLCLVLLASEVGFAAATFNPFTVGIASGIAEIPMGNDIIFRTIFAITCFTIALIYVLRYGAKVKKDPSKSFVANEPYKQPDLPQEIGSFNLRHLFIALFGVAFFAFIMYAIVLEWWWIDEMAGGFFLIGIVAIIISRLPLKEAAKSFVKGMEDMVVAALVVGFARAIEVVLSDGQILDTIVYSAASILENFNNIIAAQGMLAFQTVLNFFIPSGSGQAAVTMPIMVPLADALGLSRTTAVFAFTCGDGFSNSIIPTSGILMAMLSLAQIPFQKWIKFMFPLFLMLMAASVVFLTISVNIHH